MKPDYRMKMVIWDCDDISSDSVTNFYAELGKTYDLENGEALIVMYARGDWKSLAFLVPERVPTSALSGMVMQWFLPFNWNFIGE